MTGVQIRYQTSVINVFHFKMKASSSKSSNKETMACYMALMLTMTLISDLGFCALVASILKQLQVIYDDDMISDPNTSH